MSQTILGGVRSLEIPTLNDYHETLIAEFNLCFAAEGHDAANTRLAALRLNHLERYLKRKS
jgi:hypothetical protein